MIVTEEEAKTKRCQETFGPVAPAAFVTSGPINPFGHSFTPPSAMPINCIGSACMAWKWLLGSREVNVDRTKNDDRSVGYCGKAGLP